MALSSADRERTRRAAPAGSRGLDRNLKLAGPLDETLLRLILITLGGAGLFVLWVSQAVIWHDHPWSARPSLRRIEDNAMTHWRAHGQLPPSAVAAHSGSDCLRSGLGLTDSDGENPAFEGLPATDYVYEFVKAPAAGGWQFAARILGDLDCDGVFSTFEIIGEIDAAGRFHGGYPLYKKDELE